MIQMNALGLYADRMTMGAHDNLLTCAKSYIVHVFAKYSFLTRLWPNRLCYIQSPCLYYNLINRLEHIDIRFTAIIVQRFNHNHWECVLHDIFGYIFEDVLDTSCKWNGRFLGDFLRFPANSSWAPFRRKNAENAHSSKFSNAHFLWPKTRRVRICNLPVNAHSSCLCPKCALARSHKNAERTPIKHMVPKLL